MPVPPALERPAQAAAVAEFLDEAAAQPSGLVVEGEAGIGKTTLWLAAVEQARLRAFTVLSSRTAAAESVLAYASLCDLLSHVDATVFARLSEPQQIALDQVLLRAGPEGVATDQRAAAAGFLSLITYLADEAPVLLAIDDLQWLDSSSRRVLAYTARRLPHRTSVLATVRTGFASEPASTWLELGRPEALRRITLPPFSIGALHTILSSRLGRSFPRPTMLRIHEVSGGNPFYALELARSIDDATVGAHTTLPTTLIDLVRARIGNLDAEVRQALLAVACVSAATVDLVAQAIGADSERVIDLLHEAEAKGIVGIDGRLIRFAHPLLATGVYSAAVPGHRRAMHRRLADIVGQPELRARHLALAAVRGDPQTLESLDMAADMARNRGAPTAAAELTDLAIRLGGDTPQRRISLAGHHFASGDPGRARALLEDFATTLPAGALRAEALTLLAFIRLGVDNTLEAADLLERALAEVGDNAPLRVQILIALTYPLFYTGRRDDAMRNAADAVSNAAQLGQRHLLSQALGMQVLVGFLRGNGLDEASLRRALELEDTDADIPVVYRPSMHNAMLLAWSGQLEQAHTEVISVRRRCMERGEESELMFVDLHIVFIEIWRGNFAESARVAEDAMERALQLNADYPLAAALGMRSAVAAYAGRVEHARRDAEEASTAARRCGSVLFAQWPVSYLIFLEVSLGNYTAALEGAEPVLAVIEAEQDGTEIFLAWFVPDVIEALIGVGRLTEAEPLVDAFERNGRRLDRAWMLAVGARCRAMLLAARGDLQAATTAVNVAMAEHDRLPMPFERARTQLLLGMLERRQRHRDAATATLRDALRTFERLGTTLWADHVRAELARGRSGGRQAEGLTPSEHRVAQLAASGMTNKDIAAALFISPKTVEVNLSRVYRKLNIRSRVELYRTLDSSKE